MFILKLADLRSECVSPTSLFTAQITQLWHEESFASHLLTTYCKITDDPHTSECVI